MTANLSITQAEYRQMKADVMTEAELQACVIEAAKRRGWIFYHTHDSRRSVAGFPDLVLVHATKQRVLYRELKKQNGRTSPDQKTWLTTLTAAGADAGIWRPIDWFNQTILDELEGIPDLEKVAAELGIQLLPWQLEFGRAVLRGEQVFLQRGQRTGRSTLARVLDHIQSQKQGEI